MCKCRTHCWYLYAIDQSLGLGPVNLALGQQAHPLALIGPTASS